MKQNGFIKNLIGELNKASENMVAYDLSLDEMESPTNIKIWIPTGSTLLDQIIANNENGGIPVGRISEFSGLESTGKTLICSHILANTQKMGGLAVLMDPENAIDQNFLQRLGVNLDNLLYIQPTTLEEAFEAVELIIQKYKTDGEGKFKFITIIIDSLTVLPPKAELEGSFDPNSQMGIGAKAVSRGLRKLNLMLGREKVALVVTQQLRMKITPGQFIVLDPYTTTYGKAMQFYASVRVRLVKPEGKSNMILNEKQEALGVRTVAEVKKTRFGPPWRKREFNIMFNDGIDDLQSWFDFLSEMKEIETNSAWRKWEGEKFHEKDWKKVLADPIKLEKVKNQLVKHNVVIFEKKPQISSTEDPPIKT